MATTKIKKGDATPFLPRERSLDSLEKAAQKCEGCELFARATQTVFGEGKSSAKVLLVGEQPGDKEDLEGHPFIGPAGHVLDEALREANLNRSDVYVTNAVKHFKWEPRGKKRLHLRPHQREVLACRPWLDAELEAIAPRVIVCLGATAAQSFFGSTFRMTRELGKVLHDSRDRKLVVTYHPSAILRMTDAKEREKARAELIGALVLAKENAR